MAGVSRIAGIARNLAGRRTMCSSSADAATAFIGLGAMGYPMATNLVSGRSKDVQVWNRSRSVAEKHAAAHGSRVMDDSFAGLAEVDSVFLCLPTSSEVEQVMRRAAPHMKPGAVVVDCTSGHPQETQAIGKWLRDDHQVSLLDCAVSGGPGGAAKGTLASFVGCDDVAVVKRMVPDIETFSAHIVHLGPVGAGHAVKAINNAMNVSNLLCAAEGQLRALVGCYGRQDGPVARSSWLLWPAGWASGTL